MQMTDGITAVKCVRITAIMLFQHKEPMNLFLYYLRFMPQPLMLSSNCRIGTLLVTLLILQTLLSGKKGKQNMTKSFSAGLWVLNVIKYGVSGSNCC